MDIKKRINIHLMGIGGAGMSGLALLLDAMGHNVSGCDVDDTSYLRRLRQVGVKVEMKHNKEHLDVFSPDLIIHTSAIAQDHPELIEARKRGIPVARRAEILSLIFNDRRGIGIAGTHGKTTTSSMISLIAEHAGLYPTVAVGGESSDIGCNAKLGLGEYMVAELDESDGSFELFSPEVEVITNVDWDHVDYYPAFDGVVKAFGRFIDGRKSGALVVICGEDAGTQRLISPDMVTYGWGVGWDWGATDVRFIDGGGIAYRANRRGEPLGDVRLRLSGEHNVLNSLASIAAADAMGISFEIAVKALGIFKGAKRRLQYTGEAGGVIVYDDYGHHPREIAVTMAALSGAFGNRRIHVVFQPHRYTRTQALYREFAKVLRVADRIYLLPIYSADEPTIAGVSSFMIADELVLSGRTDATVCGDFQEASDLVCARARPGDIVLTIGAGNVDEIGRQILDCLGRRATVTNAAAVGV
ncbi:MAG: UDP-N-acetylmuramate--L-alanine ligase [Synergistaceae bacterium]|jgi:UDP-N-acetylmuramate--alanine ligase|nr:UDP-N-acetylmuramate--L-alanine ligase [Synergistaceae bacterium]